MFFRYKVEKGVIKENHLRPFDAIVIGGGGLKGLSFLGSIDFFSQCGLLSDVSFYAGTSAGSIICLLLILGYSPKEQLEFNLERSYLKFRPFSQIFNSQSLLDLSDLISAIETLCKKKVGYVPTFRQLYEFTNKSLRVVAYNASSNCQEIFSDTLSPEVLVTEAVKYSCSIPFIFEPQRSTSGEFYFDGGLVNNLPIDAVTEANNLLVISTASTGVRQSFITFSDIVQLLISVPTISSDFLRLEHFRNLYPEKIIHHVHLEQNYSPTATFGMSSEQKIDCFNSGYVFAKGI